MALCNVCCFLWTKVAKSATPTTLATTPHMAAVTAMTVEVAEPWRRSGEIYRKSGSVVSSVERTDLLLAGIKKQIH